MTLAFSEDNVKRYHEALMDYPEKLTWLQTERGLSRDIIKQHKIGWHDNGYVLPIYERGKLANIRVYKPFGKKDDKWRYLHSNKAVYLYPEDVVLQASEKDVVLLCEGELDALILNSKGFHAVSFTGGAGTVPKHLFDRFVNKEVIVCYDVDVSGGEGIVKVFDELLPVVTDLKVAIIPFDLEERLNNFKDVTDFFVRKGGTAGEFQKIINDAKRLKGRTNKLTAYQRHILLMQGQHIEMKKLWVDKIYEIYQSIEEGLTKEQIMLDLELPVSKLKNVNEMIVTYSSYTQSEQSRVPLGFPTLDGKFRNGVAKGCVMGIAAASNVGKTIMVENIITNQVEEDYRTLFFSLEQEAPQAFERMAAIALNIRPDEVEFAFKKRDNERIVQDFQKKFGRNFHICAEPDLSLSDIEELILDAENYFGELPHSVVIDYLDLINEKGDNQYTVYGEIAKGLKILAKKHKIAIFTPLQLNMDGFGGRGKKFSKDEYSFMFKSVDKNEIRYATSIFPHMDYIIGMARPDCTPGFYQLGHDKQEELRNKIYFNFLKNRDGAIDGIIEAIIDPGSLKIREKRGLPNIEINY